MSITALILLLLVSFSCNNDDNTPLQQDLDLQVKALYGGEPLVLYREYPYEEGMKVFFQLYQFYLSDIELVRADGTGEMVSEIELIRFEDTQNETSAREGVRVTLENVPAGEYIKIKMGVGVSPRLMQTSPGQYPPGHPLADNYWSAAKGYIHSKIEGRADTLSGDGFDTGITFHGGSDDIYSEVEFPIQLTIDNSVPDPLVLISDLRRVLIRPNGEFLDFRKYNVDHHVNPEVFEFIGGNLYLSMDTEK
jgi:hypothetical protein